MQRFWPGSKLVLTVLHACHQKRASGIVFDGRRRETRPTTVLEGFTGSRNKDARPFWCKAPSCKIDFLPYLDSCVRSGSISDNVLISVPSLQFFLLSRIRTHKENQGGLDEWRKAWCFGMVCPYPKPLRQQKARANNPVVQADLHACQGGCSGTPRLPLKTMSEAFF